MNFTGKKTHAATCPCPCSHTLRRIIQQHLELADKELRQEGSLNPSFTMCINDYIFALSMNFTNRKTKQASTRVMRDCCVAFSPQDVALVCESSVRPQDALTSDLPVADDPRSFDVVAIDFETPCYNAPVMSPILRAENGAYAGLDTPFQRGSINEAAGVAGFYPSTPPSQHERDAARDRLQRVLGADVFAQLCALADEPAKIA